MSNPARRPYLGETVHYQSYGPPSGELASVCQAAIVTEVPRDATRDASLAVFETRRITMMENLPHDESRRSGTWHWAH